MFNRSLVISVKYGPILTKQTSKKSSVILLIIIITTRGTAVHVQGHITINVFPMVFEWSVLWVTVGVSVCVIDSWSAHSEQSAGGRGWSQSPSLHIKDSELLSGRHLFSGCTCGLARCSGSAPWARLHDDRPHLQRWCGRSAVAARLVNKLF